MSEAAFELIHETDHGATVAGRSKLKDGFGRMRRNRMAMVGLVILALIVLACAFGPFVLPDPNASDFDSISIPPTFENGHFFGTDDLGRDLLARVLEGGRT